jgi:hypothetical protein
VSQSTSLDGATEANVTLGKRTVKPRLVVRTRR